MRVTLARQKKGIARELPRQACACASICGLHGIVRRAPFPFPCPAYRPFPWKIEWKCCREFAVKSLGKPVSSEGGTLVSQSSGAESLALGALLQEATMADATSSKQTYAETKAMGEKAMTDASCDELMTCAVAPHQVYGPRHVI